MDGAEALRKAEELKPDLVLMDMDLPRTDGLESTRRLKVSVPRTVVIIFSTLDGREYRDAATRVALTSFLRRPPKSPESFRRSGVGCQPKQLRTTPL
jgi:CheY-like chemotaxis protein